MATLDDYSQLITSEHQPQPRYMAVVAALMQPVVDQINVLQGIPAASIWTMPSACSSMFSVSGSAGVARLPRR